MVGTPVTVLALEGVQVVARREMDRDGYTAVQLGAGVAKTRMLPSRSVATSARPKSSPSRCWSSSG
jgi:ribosomal protein L3